jgi:putative DNA primase/helicase
MDTYSLAENQTGGNESAAVVWYHAASKLAGEKKPRRKRTRQRTDAAPIVEPAESSTQLGRFPLTETGDAEFFTHTFADRVRFDHRQGRWLIFNGNRWAPDADGELHRMALQSVRLRQKQSFDIEDYDKRKHHFLWTIKGESRYRIKNMLELARNLKPISDPGDRITMSTRVAYSPTAKAPLWEQTIRQIFNGDDQLIDYVQRAQGYSITGDCREECFFVSHGPGGNGKGTLMNTTSWAMGDYMDNFAISALERPDHGTVRATPELAKLPGKRFVTASETSTTMRLNEDRIKMLTGRDPVTARQLYGPEFTFVPAAKYWLSTNHKPQIDDTSDGLWRRVRLIPFTQRFIGKNADLTLKDRLRAEGPGILRCGRGRSQVAARRPRITGSGRSGD